MTLLVFSQTATLHATNTAQEKKIVKKCTESIKAIDFYRKSTHQWQDYFGIKRSKYSKAKIKPGACKYAQWVARRWQKAAFGYRSWNNTIEHADRDFDLAAKLATFVFPKITYERLWSRANVEGGHGKWVWNTQGSGAGGWFQFMEGTYYGRSDEAFAEARKQGFPLPAKFNSWRSLVGQNITAAYMFDLGLECSGEGWAASC
jgi:hypothetical protein